MGIVILAVLATVFGGLLIFLLVLAGPSPAALEKGGPLARDGSGEAFLASLSSPDLARLLELLFEAMGFEVALLSGHDEAPLLMATNSTPITGVRMLVAGRPGTAPPPDSEAVRSLLDLVRGEEAGKGLLVFAGPVGPSVIEACADSSIEVLEDTELWKLVEKRLPTVASSRVLRTSDLD